MREISLRVRRFEEIQAQTGMSSHLLSNRLKRLEEDKIIERRVYSARPLRHEYFATEKGRDLDAVMLALRNWDLRWGGNDGKGSAAVDLKDKKTGATIDGTWNTPHEDGFSFANTTSIMSDAWKAEREANAAAFYAAKKNAPARSAKSSAITRKAAKNSKKAGAFSSPAEEKAPKVQARKAPTKKTAKKAKTR